MTEPCPKKRGSRGGRKNDCKGSARNEVLPLHAEVAEGGRQQQSNSGDGYSKELHRNHSGSANH